MDLKQIESELAQYPLCGYAFLSPEKIPFSGRVRAICREECPMYGKSWSCPPAVGTVSECEARCRRFPACLMIATAAEVADSADLSQTLPTRAGHEAVTREIRRLLLDAGASEVYALSAQACTRCERCAWPDAPCRNPDAMLPCVEGHGILVSALAEANGIEFLAVPGTVTWFSLLFFR